MHPFYVHLSSNEACAPLMMFVALLHWQVQQGANLLDTQCWKLLCSLRTHHLCFNVSNAVQGCLLFSTERLHGKHPLHFGAAQDDCAGGISSYPHAPLKTNCHYTGYHLLNILDAAWLFERVNSPFKHIFFTSLDVSPVKCKHTITCWGYKVMDNVWVQRQAHSEEIALTSSQIDSAAHFSLRTPRALLIECQATANTHSVHANYKWPHRKPLFDLLPQIVQIWVLMDGVDCLQAIQRPSSVYAWRARTSFIAAHLNFGW